MKVTTLFAKWLLLSTAAGSLAVAQEKAADSASGQTASRTSNTAFGSQSSDLRLLRSSVLDFEVAFSKHDAKSIAALWTEDGDCIDETGRRLAGRDAIERAYADLFEKQPASKIKLVIDSLRLLSADAAIEDGHSILDPPPAGPPAITKYTAVHVKSNGKWLVSTVRETRVEIPSGYEKVADLEWLIGSWTAEEHGTKTVSVCRWVANKSFVERAYTVTQPDQTTTSGVQLIGFNAQTGQVQSWNFSPDGGHALGIWSPREKGWAAEIRGVTGDGATTTAVNLLTKLDNNAYVWQSTKRTAGRQSLPDTEEVVLKRQRPRN